MKNLHAVVTDFRRLLEGPVILPDEEGYDEARSIWNGIFDRKPAIIVRCLQSADVSRSVKFARSNHLAISVKGGGHNSAGNAVCDDGLMIDLSLMTEVEVDTVTRKVKVEGGCLLGTVDAETQKHGIAVSSGIVSHTGVGGLTLGGGFGWISRKYGLSVDNLISVKMVTADGRIVIASKDKNPDLFWAVRGGGGNFGIVTSFEFQGVRIGTEVYSGPLVKRFEDLEDYIKFHREYVRKMPDEMTIWLVIRYAPPLPFIREDYHGELVVLVPFVWLGDPEEGEKLIQPLRDQGETIGDGSGMKRWTTWQSAFDGLVEHGARNYWKSHIMKDLPDDCIRTIRKYVKKMPSEECEIFIPHMEGAPSRVPSASTAFPHREPPFMLNIHSRWRYISDDLRAISWARELHEAIQPFSQGVYVNFLSEEGTDRVKAAYTPEVWSRLVEVKNKWDPENLFRMNQNIPPSG